MSEPWETSVTAFTVTRRDGAWLMVRHERLGLTRWELPGGHLEAGETLEAAAARETAEEAGVSVVVGRLLATCDHEWPERRRRTRIHFFEASPHDDATPQVPPDEPRLLEAAWIDPLSVTDVSAFLVPLIEQERVGWQDAPISFRMTHRLNPDGLWEPAPAAR